MNAVRVSVVALSLWLCSAGALAAGEANTPAITWLDGPLEVAAAQSRGPGLAGAIYRGGELVELFAWGGSACDGSGEIDPNAAFEVGSIAKHMTAVGLLRLWEEGRIELDGPLGRYLDDIPETWRVVTIRQLLTHTSGVPDYEEAAGYGIYETSPAPADVFAIVSGRPLDFEPGTRWSYSNTGYYLLSLVIERISGMAFGNYMRERVFEPLQLENTFVAGYGPPGMALVQGCRPGEGEGATRIAVRPISEASTYGAGGILSTLRDWARWDDALADGRLLSPRGMELLTSPQVLADGGATDYAFGLEIDEFRGQRRFSHSGQTQGFVALYETFPDRDVGVMVFVNQYQANPAPMFDALTIRALPDLSYNRLAAPADPDPARTDAVRRAIRQYYLGEQPFDLLDPELATRAVDSSTATHRARHREAVAAMEHLVYMRTIQLDGGLGERHLYRMSGGGETSYATVGLRDGRLYRLRWERE